MSMALIQQVRFERSVCLELAASIVWFGLKKYRPFQFQKTVVSSRDYHFIVLTIKPFIVPLSND